jgi:hypothetical protein
MSEVLQLLPKFHILAVSRFQLTKNILKGFVSAASWLRIITDLANFRRHHGHSPERQITRFRRKILPKNNSNQCSQMSKSKIRKIPEFFFWNPERFLRVSFNRLKYVRLDQIMNNHILHIHKIIQIKKIHQNITNSMIKTYQWHSSLLIYTCFSTLSFIRIN